MAKQSFFQKIIRSKGAWIGLLSIVIIYVFLFKDFSFLGSAPPGTTGSLSTLIDSLFFSIGVGRALFGYSLLIGGASIGYFIESYFFKGRKNQ